MLSRTKARHHVVVAYLALFVALGGSAVAAKPLIDGADVKDESLTTADIRNDSLTGDDILESTLGKVSSATVADSATTAGDADTLDGRDSVAFIHLAGRVTADGEVSPNTVGGGGSGFTPSKFDTGEYRIEYPAGTFGSDCRLPFVQVTPGTLQEVRIGATINRSCGWDGSGSFNVNFVDGAGTPQDTAFHFLAVPSPVAAPLP